MHLIELIEVLERTKVARGNVKLVDVIVVASGDPKPVADYADRSAARSAPAKLAMDVTGMNDDQVEELRAQYPDHELIRRAPEANEAPGEPCNVVDVAKGACTLAIGHEGDHAWTNPDAALDPSAQKVAQELSSVMEAAAAKLPPQLDDKAIEEQAKHDAATAPPAAQEVDALKMHEDHQAELAQQARAKITEANAIEGEQPE